MKENDPYYLGNRDCPPIRITFQTGNGTITQELPWDASTEDIMTAVHAAMIGMTYLNTTVIHAMHDYAESQMALEKSDSADECIADDDKVIAGIQDEKEYRLAQIQNEQDNLYRSQDGSFGSQY